MIKSEVGLAVYDALREAGMTVAVPQREVRVRQEPPSEPANPPTPIQ